MRGTPNRHSGAGRIGDKPPKTAAIGRIGNETIST
jgi:hypothetical protein